MAVSTARYPTDQRAAQLAKALAHPARIAILRSLGQHRECICGELVAVAGLAQSSVSQHLNVLKEAGLVQGRVEGPRSCYCLHPQAVAELRSFLGGFLAGLDAPHEAADCC